MIHSFEDSITEEIFHGTHSHAVRKRFPSGTVKRIQRTLDLLNAAPTLEALQEIPSHKPDPLVRDAHASYSIPVDATLRITFHWTAHGPARVQVR